MSVKQPKDSSRIRGDARARREQRQLEADERNVRYRNFSEETRLELLAKRPGQSKRERAKLMHKIESRRKVVKK